MAVQKPEVKKDETPVRKQAEPQAKAETEELGVGPSDVTARRVQAEATRQKNSLKGE